MAYAGSRVTLRDTTRKKAVETSALKDWRRREQSARHETLAEEDRNWTVERWLLRVRHVRTLQVAAAPHLRAPAVTQETQAAEGEEKQMKEEQDALSVVTREAMALRAQLAERDERVRSLEAALARAENVLADIGDAEGPDRRGVMPTRKTYETWASNALPLIRSALAASPAPTDGKPYKAAHYPEGMGEESRRLHREYNVAVTAQMNGANNGADIVRITDECAAKGIILVPRGEKL